MSGDHDRRVRGYLVAGLIGAAIGSAFFVLSDALSPQSNSYCPAAEFDCPRHPLFTWSAVRPGWALIGAAVGAILGVGLHALRLREQRRRDRVGV